MQGDAGYQFLRGGVTAYVVATKDWPEILAGDEVMATALMDRLLQRCRVLSFKGRSYRLRDLEEILKKERA